VTAVRAWVALVLLSVTSARADPPAGAGPGWRLSGEALAAVSTGVLHDVGVSSWGFRLGLGAREHLAPGVATRGSRWLVTVAGNASGFGPVASVREGRLGLGVRFHFRRVAAGGDVELVLVDVDRVSSTRPLRGTGFGARLVGSYDLVQLGDVAFLAALEASLTALGWPGAPTYWPQLQAGVGLSF
jgi:hypothetical protein